MWRGRENAKGERVNVRKERWNMEGEGTWSGGCRRQIYMWKGSENMEGRGHVKGEGMWQGRGIMVG